MRRLVGMEIVDEDSSNVNVHFLLDATTLSPEKILKRMSSIALGMFRDTLNTLTSNDKSVLQTIPNRDDEIDRQYFLLVRLIRTTMVDKKLANALNLENIDILDYRIAANLLEAAGDTMVDLAKSISELALMKKIPKKYWLKINDTFVMYGQNICKPISPMCDVCQLKNDCKYYRATLAS